MSDEAQQMLTAVPSRAVQTTPRVPRALVHTVSVRAPRRRLKPQSDAEFVVDLVARNTAYLDRVDVSALAAQLMAKWQPQPLDSTERAELALLITNLISDALAEGKRVLHNRMIVDMATVLIPRLEHKNRKQT